MYQFVRLTAHHIKVWDSRHYLIRYLHNIYLFICMFNVGEIYFHFLSHGPLVMLTAHHTKYTIVWIILFCYLLTFYLFICNLQWVFTKFSGLCDVGRRSATPDLCQPVTLYRNRNWRVHQNIIVPPTERVTHRKSGNDIPFRTQIHTDNLGS